MKPTTREDFDRAYQKPFTFWGDVRIPEEVKALAHGGRPDRVLEFGCGVGRFSRYLARQGLRATGVDFSQVAIAKAKAAAVEDGRGAEFRAADVTRLDVLSGPFDASFDVGCFHCLDEVQRRAYASEVFRLLAPGGTHLIWALDVPPSDMEMSPRTVEATFSRGFALQGARKSWRRLVPSHWYWLVRQSEPA